jgi:hypothetical protein
VVKNNKLRKIKQYTVAENSKPPLTRRQKNMILSPIPRNLTDLMSTNELMARAQIEEFLSHLVSSNTNMSFMGTDFGPGLLHQGQLYWDNVISLLQPFDLTKNMCVVFAVSLEPKQEDTATTAFSQRFQLFSLFLKTKCCRNGHARLV